ncbi:Negative regulator of mitotic exit [Podila verticillata]|nr:Negative regulator of mitotic exit [Podila verticillata]
MAGLFSKKSKKDRDDKSSSRDNVNGNGNFHYNTDNSSSANNSITNSDLPSTTHSHPSHSNHPYSHSFSSKNSLEGDKARYHQQQQHVSHQHHQQLNQHRNHHQGSQGSLSTFNSMANPSLSSTGPWASALVMSTNPFPRFAHTASHVSTGTDIYIFGGIVKGSPQKDVHVIDFQSLHCQRLPIGGDSPPATSGHTAVTIGQYVMYFGGKDAKNKCNDVLYVLHTARKEWNRPTFLGLLPPPRHSHAACVVGTTMYIFGGRLNSYYLNDIAAFDMKSLNGKNPKWNQLEPISQLPPARAGHSAAAYDGKVYIFGGADDKYYYNDIWCYDPKTNGWEAVPAYGVLPTSRQGHTVAVLDDTMYIFGGMNHEDQLLGELCAFKFNERKWLSFPNILNGATPRSEHSMCCIGDKIYILGGQLDLNANNEDAGTIYVLDTNKIRYTEPSFMSSQRSDYDIDAVRHEGQERSSPYNDHPDQGKRFQQQYQQQQQHQQKMERQGSYNQQIDRQGSYTGAQDHHSVRAGESPSRLSLEFAESTHVARRRTIGKPVGFSVHEFEPRGTQSIDEIRRNTSQQQTRQEDEYNERDAPRGPSQQQSHSSQGNYGYEDDRGHGEQRSASGNGYHRSNQSNNSLPIRSNAGSQLELNRQGSNSNLDVMNREPLNRAGSYASINNMQTAVRMSVETSQRAPLRIANPDHQRDYLRLDQSSASASPSLSSEQTPSVVTPTTVTSSHVTKSTKDIEIKDLKQREQWLLAEVSMARKKMGDRPLSMAIMALEDELEVCEVGSDKYRIMQALLNVKAELERSKTTIATQAQAASNKVREAERVRTSALQEAAYLKAKVSALQTGEASSLVATETARATDLEKRLAAALAQNDQFQQQLAQYDTILEHERLSRESAEEREREASSRADDAQQAHTRALSELSMLHERASGAEAEVREWEARSATSEAGLSSYQQQSTALFSQISTLKTTVDHQKKSLEKAKLAYSVANERAEQADRNWTLSRQEMDQTQMDLANVRADMDRAQREADHWKAKAKDVEKLWAKSKSENEALRTMLEEEMNDNDLQANQHVSGPNSPTITSKDRKHDSIMAITSASRLAELEHELGSLRVLLKESQARAAKANKELSDTMVRISQLEQSSMASRAEAASAQRRLTESKDQVTMLQTQLIRKEEALEEMSREQENHEVQLGLLRGVMKENGLLAEDLMLEALSLHESGEKAPVGQGWKNKAHDAEKRADEAEVQIKEMLENQKQQKQKIQQLEADYQTAVHYAEGSESILQRLNEEAQKARNELEAVKKHRQSNESVAELEDELAQVHRQLHEAHERSLQLEQQVEEISTRSQSNSKSQDLERTLAQTREMLEQSQYDLEQAHEMNKTTGQELEDALRALKSQKKDTQSKSQQQRQQDLETAVENAQRTIQSLQETNQDLENQLRASENKISLLLDNFHGADSVRNSVVSLSGMSGINGYLGGAGSEEYLKMMIDASASQQQQPQPSSPSPSRQHNSRGSPSPMSPQASVTSPTTMSPSSYSSRQQYRQDQYSTSTTPTSPRSLRGQQYPSRSSPSPSSHHQSNGLSSASTQKLEEYERMIEDMAKAPRQFSDE